MTKPHQQPDEIPVRYGFIITVSIIMFLGIWVIAGLIGLAMHTEPHTKAPTRAPQNPQDNLSSLKHAPVPTFQVGIGVGKARGIRAYYSRRAYYGAPPIIPHPIAESKGNTENCLTCHKQGGYVPKYKAYAPVTPHPTLINCTQCHVPQTTPSLFRQNASKSVRPPRLGISALPGGPPPIPHTLQMRRNCIACHAGPGSLKAIRTPHPQRTNCMQCHVPQQRVKPFRSALHRRR